MRINWGIALMIIASMGNLTLTAINLNLIHELDSFNPFYKPVENPENCTGGLMETSICLWKIQGEFYNYNLTNKEKKMNDSELRREGGVCWHYAEWYIGQAQALGFKAEKISIYQNSTYGHAFAVIHNEEGYCVMDQNKFPDCMIYNKEKEDE